MWYRHNKLYILFPFYLVLANFITPFSYGKSSLAWNASQCRPLLDNLVISQPVCHSFVPFMIRRFIVGVVSEVVLFTHIWYIPFVIVCMFIVRHTNWEPRVKEQYVYWLGFCNKIITNPPQRKNISSKKNNGMPVAPEARHRIKITKRIKSWCTSSTSFVPASVIPLFTPISPKTLTYSPSKA